MLDASFTLVWQPSLLIARNAAAGEHVTPREGYLLIRGAYCFELDLQDEAVVGRELLEFAEEAKRETLGVIDYRRSGAEKVVFSMFVLAGGMSTVDFFLCLYFGSVKR